MVMTKPPLLRLDQAQITRDSGGTVTIDDSESPILVSVRVAPTPHRHITELIVTARHPSGRITPAGLARLPLDQIRHIAARSDPHPNDLPLRAEITPKLPGQRSWGVEHWRQVLDVYQWAVSTNRPGGGPRAVADMWDVTRNPTAYRWITHARSILTGQTDMPRARAISSNPED